MYDYYQGEAVLFSPRVSTRHHQHSIVLEETVGVQRLSLKFSDLFFQAD